MGDGPGFWDQMRELRARESVRAQRERALVLQVVEKATEHLVSFDVDVTTEEQMTRALAQMSRTARALRQALLDLEIWKAANT